MRSLRLGKLRAHWFVKASCESFFAVFAYLIVTREYTEVPTIFDHLVLEKVFRGADQKMTLP